MGNGVSTDQGNFPTHGIRDVRRAADRKQHDWSPLAEAPITKQPNLLIATANSYIHNNYCMICLSRIVQNVFHVIVIAGASCSAAAGDLVMKSKCYRTYYTSPLTWWSASNDCLSRGGSLAVFTDIGRPSDNSQLTNWLTNSGTDKTYWIGLVRSWWKTTNEGNS